jgi:Fe-Mn family superoxide dismutase
MYTQKDFSHLLGMTGFSDTLLNNHFTLYGAYVNNVNKIVIETLMKNKLEVGSIEKSEVTRRLG